MKEVKSVHPLQTKEWAEFRTAWGNEIIKTKYGFLSLHKIPLLNKKIAMFIRGPQPTKSMLSELKKLGVKHNLIFIKLEPFELQSKSLRELLKNNNCVPGKTLFTPTSFWVDLTRTENELLASFNSKTRYNIRLAERKGVKVSIDNSDKAFEKYIKLTRQTVERQKFYAHNEKYHRLMWKYLKKDIANLLVAKYKNRTLATWILFKFGKFLYYPYGASTEEHKELMASNLMMWEAIKFGKKLNLQTFDLWGREEGKGFTRFKEGYNPKVVEFIGTWDLIINKPLYQIYLILEKLRWIILRSKSRFQKPKF